MWRLPRSRRQGSLGARLSIAAGLIATAAATAQEGEELELGRRVFLLHCAVCHGEQGDGYGERHYITYARPRAFQSARYKLASTENRVPSDADLIRTIELGMPGSGMPNWGWLPREEIAAVASYVRWLGVEAIRAQLAREVEAGRLSAVDAQELLVERTRPGNPVVVPPEPEPSPERRQRGARIYADACASCHGARGWGIGATLLSDFEGNRLPATSLGRGIFKGGREGREIYLRVLKGMDGTAMPGFEDAYSPDELWDVVHHVEGLATAGEGDGLPVPERIARGEPRPSAIPPAPFDDEPGVGPSPRSGDGRRLGLGLVVGLAVLALVMVLLALALGGWSR